MLRRRNALSINGARPASYSAAHLNHVEAIAHLERSLALLKSLYETEARDTLERDVQLALGVSYITVQGMSAAAVREAYDRALDLAEKRSDRSRLFQALYGLWQHNSGAGQISTAQPLSQRLLRLTEADVDSGLAAPSTSQRLDDVVPCWHSGGGSPA